MSLIYKIRTIRSWRFALAALTIVPIALLLKPIYSAVHVPEFLSTPLSIAIGIAHGHFAIRWGSRRSTRALRARLQLERDIWQLIDSECAVREDAAIVMEDWERWVLRPHVQITIAEIEAELRRRGHSAPLPTS